jgi:hypothetical protein
MRRSRAILCALIFGLSVVAKAAGQAPSPATVLPQDVEKAPLFPSRQNVFDIPFEIDDPIPGQEPVEVQLHVSENRGATWHLQSKAKPDERRFSFRAPHDGEYWFLVRTLNKQGRLLPEVPFAPEVRVWVDSEPPTIELSCNRTAGGEIACTWKLADPNLKASTLQLTYQGVDSGPHWQTVVVAPSAATGDGAWIGKATFVPAGVKPPIFVRVEVADEAGNRATAQAQVETPAGGGLNSLPSTAVDHGPWKPASPSVAGSSIAEPKPLTPTDFGTSGTVAKSVASGGNSPSTRRPSPDLPPTMSERFPGREAIPTPRGKPDVSQYRPTGKLSGGDEPGESEVIGPGATETLPSPEPKTIVSKRTLLPESPAAPQVSAKTSPAPLPVAPIATASPALKPAEPVSPTFDAPKLPPPATGPTLGSEPTLPVASAPLPSNSVPTMPSRTDVEPPPGVKPRMVNSRRFELEYDIESAGNAGISQVELWTTRDGGKSWTLSGTDPDGVSPYAVNVPDEGIYGFRMVIETTSGLRTPSPLPGDLPDVWIGVDVTKPTAKFVGIQQGTGEQVGELEIRWQVADAQLSSRPVGISFSEKSEGPWTTIATGLPAELDHYAWRLDAKTPEKFFLKLDVRDIAGNVTSLVTPQPVTIERVRPQGRIRSVRPIGESARLRAASQIVPR